MLFYKDILESVEKKETTFLDFTSSILDKINEYKHLNAFITITNDLALESAKESDIRFANGTQRPLEGMIIALKDNLSTEGIRTTCASKMLENFVPIYDATVVERLKNAGAIIIGKTNMDEFAMGSSNETSYFGGVKNCHDNEYVPGGSSGGSATAVAAGFCHVALGSDTGGSIRQPASFSGIYGFKPSYGTISRYGLIAFASSLDQIGGFSSNLEDLTQVIDIISGYDEKDSTILHNKHLNSYQSLNSYNDKKVKIGVLKQKEVDKCDEEVYATYNSLIQKLKNDGNEIVEVEFANSEAWIPTYYILATAECSSNLSRFDGVRFGFRAKLKQGDNFYTKTRSQGFGEEVKRRIMIGTYVLSSGYYDAYYQKAQKMRRIIYNDYQKAFGEVDAILMPSTPTPAFKSNEKNQNPLSMYLSDFYTASANIAGICGISIPAGFSKDGLPIGMQLQAKNQDDEKLLALSKKVSNLIKIT